MPTIHNCIESRKVIRARGRLSDAKKVFADRQWDVLPQGIRGQRILRWGADQAYLAGPANPERSVRRWCCRWWPTLKPAELDEIVAYTKTSNKRWSDDESAAVLEINLADHQRLHLRFIGADDDPNYEIREGLQREKNAGYSRTYRTKRSTGRPRGRPASATGRRRKGAVTRSEWLAANSTSQVKPWIALGIKRSWYYELKKRGELDRTGPAENPSGDISNNRRPDAISVAPVQSDSPAFDRGPPQAAPSPPPRPIVIRLDAAPDGLILDEDGNEFKVPPPHQRRPPPRDWMEAAFEGYTGGRS
jgi:hypothetical protein